MDRGARIVQLVLAGTLTGNELGGFVAVHPALDTLDPSTRLHAEQAVYRRFGAIMPFLMTGTVAASAAAAGRSGARSPVGRLYLGATACFGAMLAVTLAGNVPINRELLALEDDPAGRARFAELRDGWNRLHAARNALNVTGLLLSAAAATA